MNKVSLSLPLPHARSRPGLQHQVIRELLHYGDAPAAAHWAVTCHVAPDTLPLSVQVLLMEGNPRYSKINYLFFLFPINCKYSPSLSPYVHVHCVSLHAALPRRQQYLQCTGGGGRREVGVLLSIYSCLCLWKMSTLSTMREVSENASID